MDNVSAHAASRLMLSDPADVGIKQQVNWTKDK